MINQELLTQKNIELSKIKANGIVTELGEETEQTEIGD